ncbi:MAG: DUF4145 domain-containing protein [Nitrospirae bacterium]|nr:DUF4145 domain-containing protein [Nitrospirota bacterium]
MSILVISDNFCKIEAKASPELKCLSWKDVYRRSLTGAHCLLIDMTFEENIRREEDKLRSLFDLYTKMSADHFLNENRQTLVLVCGSDVFEISDSIECYDFLSKIIPEPSKIFSEKGDSTYALVEKGHVRTYLDQFASGQTFVSCYYDPKVSKHLVPLAATRDTANWCVAFEYRDGNGNLVVLPPYKAENIAHVFEVLLSVCKSYVSKRELLGRRFKFDTAIPENIRNTFYDAEKCYQNDLYLQSVMTCRRALEMSAIDRGISSGGGLNIKLTKLKDAGVINDPLFELADRIRGFGNLAAHGEKADPDEINGGSSIIEEGDAIECIDYLKIFFDYVYVIPKRIVDSNIRIERLKALKKGEIK